MNDHAIMSLIMAAPLVGGTVAAIWLRAFNPLAQPRRFVSRCIDLGLLGAAVLFMGVAYAIVL